MKKTKEHYINLAEKIFFKYDLPGSLLEKTYTDAIRNDDLTCCYVDPRIKNSSKLRKELAEILQDFLNDYPDAIKPQYLQEKEMRFENMMLKDLDIETPDAGNYLIPATDELIDITNKIRKRQGYTDLVGAEYENDVYYTYYLRFDSERKELDLWASIAYGEKDDYACYMIDLLPEEKETLLWKIIRQLLQDID